MQPGDADLLTFAPVVTLRATSLAASPGDSPVSNSAKPTGNVQFALLGLSNMLNSGGSMTQVKRNVACVEGALLDL